MLDYPALSALSEIIRRGSFEAAAAALGGKGGGGRPDMAQAGGTDPDKLPAAMASVQAWVEQKL